MFIVFYNKVSIIPKINKYCKCIIVLDIKKIGVLVTVNLADFPTSVIFPSQLIIFILKGKLSSIVCSITVSLSSQFIHKLTHNTQFHFLWETYLSALNHLI